MPFETLKLNFQFLLLIQHYLFHDLRQISLDVVLCQNTKHHKLNGEVGNNFQVVSHLSIGICRKIDLRCGK